MRVPRVLTRRMHGPAVLSFASLWLLASVQFASAQGDRQRFDTPEAAAEAMLAALRDDDTAALIRILGPAFQERVSADRRESSENRRRIYDSAQQHLGFDRTEDEVVLVIGSQAWPFPIPLEREGGKWQFDTEAGIEEIANRIVGENELIAIEVCQAFGEAQRQYAVRDRDRDGVREFAQRLGSSPGQQDGLYWEEAAFGGEVSPFGPLLDDAKGGNPYQGYYYRLLTRQGSDAPGGRYDYVINGNMIAGFALLASPADYAETGIMTFVVSHHGKVYQKDLGEKTEELAEAMDEYAPDSTWTEVE